MKIIWAFIWAFAPFIGSIAVIAMFSHAPKLPAGADAAEQSMYRACIDPNFGGNDERSTECLNYRAYHEIAQKY